MSVVRFKRPTVTHARLIPWEIGVPCIWFRYGDGYEVLSDARVKTPDVLQAISKLGPADRAKLDALIEAADARPLESASLQYFRRVEPGTDWFEYKATAAPARNVIWLSGLSGRPFNLPRGDVMRSKDRLGGHPPGRSFYRNAPWLAFRSKKTRRRGLSRKCAATNTTCCHRQQSNWRVL